MSKTWNGPSEAVKAMSTDFLAVRLCRRAMKQGVAYNLSHDGRSAEVYTIQKRAGEWYRHDLGIVRGGDPMNVEINVALQHTPHDPELLSIVADQIQRRTDDVLGDLAFAAKQLDAACFTIGDALESLAVHCE